MREVVVRDQWGNRLELKSERIQEMDFYGDYTSAWTTRTRIRRVLEKLKGPRLNGWWPLGYYKRPGGPVCHCTACLENGCFQMGCHPFGLKETQQITRWAFKGHKF